MSDACAGMLLLMHAAGLDPHLHADERVGMVFTHDDFKSIGQGGDAGIQGGD